MERKRPNLIVDAFIEKDGKFLAIKRSSAVEVGSWETPGGRVDVGERVEDALVREMEEETGLKVRIKRFLGWGEGFDCPHQDGYLCQRFVLYFLCDVASGELKIDPGEALEYKWVTPEEFKKLEPLSKPIKDFFDKNVL
ncbi:MAG: NUDIX domain-containing protein [Candidatus Aenigmatarchaeota archaeon]|nr:MAG: NUDIX domain-containing protein [Candidatus Aenigmarchaeota archaeon]